ncbi:MAG: FAD-binding protein [Candidatus Micrarchaeota archaeon]|nr:FAD-binding protein [Candidatus Micrarchaeota archaeon]
MDLIAALQRVVGKDGVKSKDKELKAYQNDKSYISGKSPEAVVLPSNAKQVSEILKLCNSNGIGVVARGGGSSLTGSSVPYPKSIVLDLSRMNRILETRIEDGYLVAEPCATIDEINKHLENHEYFYPPDPASSGFATLGGTISTNAGGLRAIMYGSTKEWVLGLEVVLPSGEIINTGSRTLKRSLGYDLTGLVVGSEGTLGVVTKAIIKIIPRPESIGRILAYYKRFEDAARAVEEIKRKGITPLIAEFMDRTSMELMAEAKRLPFPERANCMLLIDIATTKDSLDRFIGISETALRKHDPILVNTAKSRVDMERLHAARKLLFMATEEKAKSTGRSVIVADAIVPPSEMPSALAEVQKAMKKVGLEAVLFGHIGDGNIHVNILANLKTQRAKAEGFLEALGEIALDHNGSVSGEHGIGLEKKGLLIKELKKRDSIEVLRLMKEIKKSFDPKGILNKGKIFD